MGEWKEYKLTEIASIIGDGLHGTPKFDPTGEYFFINGNNLYQGRILIKSDTQKLSEEEYKKYSKPLSDRTILLSINGTIGNLALYNNERCVLGKSACYINIKEEHDRYFLYYVFMNKDFQNYLIGTATGTTILNVPLKGLREYSFLCPPFPVQKSIVVILKSIDDKISLLHHQNATLEKMAETIYRQWFIEEAKEDWKDGTLGDIIDLNYGKSLKEELRTGKGYPVVGSSGIVGYHSEYLVEGPGIVIGRKGTLGVVVYLKDNFFPIDTTYYVTPKKSSLLPYYNYCLLKSINFEELNSDSAVPGLNRNIALAWEIKIPPINKIIEFNNWSQDFFKKIESNQQQIQILTQLRDTLLPKLMSGEIKVTD